MSRDLALGAFPIRQISLTPVTGDRHTIGHSRSSQALKSFISFVQRRRRGGGHFASSSHLSPMVRVYSALRFPNLIVNHSSHVYRAAGIRALVVAMTFPSVDAYRKPYRSVATCRSFVAMSSRPDEV